ncbi:MAG: hypothetical protein ACLQGT_08875 [Terracidiphilus sp.]
MVIFHKQLPWPDRFEERFHIFALGEAFDVDSFLATSKLHPDYVWRRKGNGPTNGLELLLGDAEVIHLPEQEEVAVAYLKAHRDELRALAEFPGVEALNLGLVYRLPLGATGCAPGPPRNLMLHALDTGVTPHYYVTLEGRQVESQPIVRKLPKGKTLIFERWGGTPLWKAIDNAIVDLVQTGGLVEDTHHEFIVERLCVAVGRRKKAIIAQLDR